MSNIAQIVTEYEDQGFHKGSDKNQFQSCRWMFDYGLGYLLLCKQLLISFFSFFIYFITYLF